MSNQSEVALSLIEASLDDLNDSDAAIVTQMIVDRYPVFTGANLGDLVVVHPGTGTYMPVHDLHLVDLSAAPAAALQDLESCGSLPTDLDDLSARHVPLFDALRI